MTADAIIWTEGKTDVQHLRRAADVLKFSRWLEFKPGEGDDPLLKQCKALAKLPQAQPSIFIFDRDKPDITAEVLEDAKLYKTWGNNVFSFAIPVPDHRSNEPGVCLELYFHDEDLCTKDADGRRIFVSSEFNPSSGRHRLDPALSVGNKGSLRPDRKTVGTRILDTDVYDSNHKNVTLSKALLQIALKRRLIPSLNLIFYLSTRFLQ
jgi:RNA-directed DNA polymerase